MPDMELKTRITITREAHNCIRRASIGGEFRDTSESVPDEPDMLYIWITEDVRLRFDELRMPGETDSDVIVRMFAHYQSGNRLQ